MNTKDTMTDYSITPTSFRSVELRDAFWRPRLETTRTVTLPDVLAKCEEFGRVDNFRNAARRQKSDPAAPGAYRGKMPFEDTDVYKAIEGASYSLARSPDARLEARLDELIALVAAAQEPDGYLYTNRTIDPGRVLPDAGPARWSNLVMSHELYNCGHLYEAAYAHHLATGKRSLLDVALRSAQLIRGVFGPAGRHDMCGHQIVEMGLARLYRITRDRRPGAGAVLPGTAGASRNTTPVHLRGEPGYCQDHAPVTRQREAVGHAVRAAYMYCGMADVAAMIAGRGLRGGDQGDLGRCPGVKDLPHRRHWRAAPRRGIRRTLRASQPHRLRRDLLVHRVGHVESPPVPAHRPGTVHRRHGADPVQRPAFRHGAAG